MKRVYLLRHAKSDWTTETPSDHERPLAPRGVAAAGAVGRFLAAIDQSPDVILTSSAVRARVTAELAREAGAWTAKIGIESGFYGAEPGTLLGAIQEQQPETKRLLLVGHEPTWSETVGRLVGQAEVKMVTAALARVDLAIENWSEASFGSGVLCWLVTPKLLSGLSGS